jgi:hypothetical protein
MGSKSSKSSSSDNDNPSPFVGSGNINSDSGSDTDWWDVHEFSTTSNPSKFREPSDVADAIGRPIPVYMVYTKQQLAASHRTANMTLLVGTIVSLLVSFIGAALIFHYQSYFQRSGDKKILRELRDLLREDRDAQRAAAIVRNNTANNFASDMTPLEVEDATLIANDNMSLYLQAMSNIVA